MPVDTDDGDAMDVVAVGIVIAAILLFVATGSRIAPAVVDSLLGRGPGPDRFLLNAFLINIAIILFGWSRYRDLREQVSSSRKAEKQARRMADTDALTGFLNHRSFNERVNGLLAGVMPRRNAVALMMVDLDNFKQVNDFNGHQTGDALLRECAFKIQQCAPPDAALGRIGGDEFAIAFAFELDRPGQVNAVAAELVEAIGRTTSIGTLDIEVTASVGVARSDYAPVNGRMPDSRALLQMADTAMYLAKRGGRNGFHCFESQMAEEMHTRAQLELGIRLGIQRGEFVPFYEQQVNLKTGELNGFEMLARWNSPEFGTVSPEVFIPIAEEIGAIAELSEAVIAQALQDAKGWDPRLSLAVNISPLQLRDPWFAQKLLRMLVEANFPPHRLEIEITESCLHDNIAQAQTLITSLKNQGIRVSLDDFGTGYSSLAQLRSLPFDRIKIDRSFVSNLMLSRDSAAFVRAIALLGEGLDLPVTAEGIESDEVLQHLMQYGALTGQGYLYGRPRPAGQLEEWMAERGTDTPPVAPPAAPAADPAADPAVAADDAAPSPDHTDERRARNA